MIGLIAAGIGALAGSQIKLSLVTNSSSSSTMTMETETEARPVFGFFGDDDLKPGRGLFWQRTVDWQTEQLENGKYRHTRKVEFKQKIGFENSRIAGAIVGAGLFALALHPLLTLIGPYRDLDNRYDQYGLVQLFPGATLGR